MRRSLQHSPHVAPPPAPAPRTLSTLECWTRLRDHDVGRLGFPTGRGPRYVVRPYTVRHHEVVVRVPAYAEAAQLADGLYVTFEVTTRLPEGAAQRVEAIGRARLDPPAGDVLTALPDEHWPAGLPSWLVCLEVDVVRGESLQAR